MVIGRYGPKHQKNPKNSVGHRVEAVVRSIERPVLVVSEPFVKPESVLLAWDGSSASKKALEYVASASVFHGLQIHVVHVGSEKESSNNLLEQAVSKLQISHPNAKAAGLS